MHRLNTAARRDKTPGQPGQLPGTAQSRRPISWDANVCHDFYWDSAGVHDMGTGLFYSWSSLPFKQPPPAGPVPTQTSYLPLPTLPFCPVPPWCP